MSATMMLFDDLSVADFKAQYYRKRPLLVRGGARTILGKLYTPSDFGVWRRKMEQHHAPYVLDAGSVVAVLRASAVVPELKQVADRFTAEFPGVIAAFDTFCTGGESGASVGAHFDDNDNFILQQSGRKRWKVARPEYVHPESAHARAVRKERLGQVIMADEQLELELEAGDALYIPSFWIHWGIGVGESLSVSLALNPVDTEGLLRQAEIYPRVRDYLERSTPPEPRIADPERGLAALSAWARRPVRVTSEPRRFGDIATSALLESSARAGVASLLDALPNLRQQPIAEAHANRFVRCLATLGTIEESIAEALLFSNLFAFLAERALDAIVFADSYKLCDVGDVIAKLGEKVRDRAGGDPLELLRELGDAPALQELAGATDLAPVWRDVAKVDPELSELGLRFAPIALRAPLCSSERPARSSTLRIGTPLGPGASLLEGEEERAVYALGHRVGRALSRALPAFYGILAFRPLAALDLGELEVLSDFCRVYGLVACAGYAGRSGRSLRRAALVEAASERADVVLADARLTERAQATLLRALRS